MKKKKQKSKQNAYEKPVGHLEIHIMGVTCQKVTDTGCSIFIYIYLPKNKTIQQKAMKVPKFGFP